MKDNETKLIDWSIYNQHEETIKNQEQELTVTTENR